MYKTQKFVADALAAETDGCILWPYAVRKSSGYGAFSKTVNGKCKHFDVHRFVCVEAHGNPTSDAPEAAHSCGNKLCLNPRHLYWASHKQNMEDAKRHGTIRGGGRHRQRIFTEDAAFIAKSGMSILELAERYQTSASHIAKVRRSVA
jgi:hypothetical protein